MGDVEPLDPERLERLASAAYLGGRREEGYELWAAAHNAYTARGDVARAARCAFWIAFGLLNSNELARGGGWVARAQRLLDEAGLDCVEQGHLRYASALKAIFSGDGETAYGGFAIAVQIGDRFGDVEISTLARIGVGRCLIYMGDVAAGVALLDEAMGRSRPYDVSSTRPTDRSRASVSSARSSRSCSKPETSMPRVPLLGN